MSVAAEVLQTLSGAGVRGRSDLSDKTAWQRTRFPPASRHSKQHSLTCTGIGELKNPFQEEEEAAPKTSLDT